MEFWSGEFEGIRERDAAVVAGGPGALAVGE